MVQISKPALINLADRLGVEYSPEWSADILADAIQRAGDTAIKKANADAAPAKPVIAHNNTADQVRQAIEPLVAKHAGFEQIYNDVSWTFRCKGAEDSGNLNIPLRLIKVKAETVARGARKPFGFNDGEDKVLWA